MRFEEERVACSMVREGGSGEGAGKEFKAAAAFRLSSSPGWMDYPVGRALGHARFGLQKGASEASCMARGWREFATCHVASQPLTSAVFPFPFSCLTGSKIMEVKKEI